MRNSISQEMYHVKFFNMLTSAQAKARTSTATLKSHDSESVPPMRQTTTRRTSSPPSQTLTHLHEAYSNRPKRDTNHPQPRDRKGTVCRMLSQTLVSQDHRSSSDKSSSFSSRRVFFFPPSEPAGTAVKLAQLYCLKNAASRRRKSGPGRE